MWLGVHAADRVNALRWPIRRQDAGADLVRPHARVRGGGSCGDRDAVVQRWFTARYLDAPTKRW
jgi:hypothetical protein